MGVTISGTFSGLDVNSIINAVVSSDKIPITALQTTDTTLSSNNSDLTTLNTSLRSLSTSLQTLNSLTLFSSQSATVADTSVGSASVSGTTANGAYNLDVQQVATNTVLVSGSTTGAYSDTKLTAPPAGTETVASLLNESSVAGQTITINGAQITLAQTDVIDDGNPNSANSLIGKINNSSAGVTATYNSSTGSFTIASNTTAPVILGAATDSSDFLQQAQLFNNGATSVSSTIGIGRVNTTSELSQAGLRTAPVAGNFAINGVSIAYNSTDSLNTLMQRINLSSAGVTATYDSYDDHMVLTSNTRGPQNITVTNGTSNIATALRLGSSDSQTQQGKPTLFTVGNSTTVRQSDSNVLSSFDLGVGGLSFTATGTGATSVTVSPDTTTIANAINSFVTQYNATQTSIDGFTVVDPNDSSKNGSLSNQISLTFLPFDLRTSLTSSHSATSTVRMLSDLGIESNGSDNTLTQVDTTKLQNALTNHLSEIESLFNDPLKGLTTVVQSVLDNYDSPLNGTVVNIQTNNNSQIKFNLSQISQMQLNITSQTAQLQNEFALLDSTLRNAQSISSILGSTNTSSSGSIGGTSNSNSSSSSSSTGN